MSADLKLSQRVQAIPPSGIRRFFDLANELKGQVLSLSIGEPDFVTPWRVVNRGIESLEQGQTHYTPNAGLLPLREAISAYLMRRYQTTYDPATEILCTVGGSEAIDLVMRALLDPGDEVLLPEPCFVAYRACATLAGAKVVSLALDEASGYALTAEALEQAITEKTRLLILAYPSNPTGAVWTKQDCQALAAVLQRHPQVAILTDELYFELDYTDEAPRSLIQDPALKQRIFYVGGFSKAFAMTGWRIGYLCGPARAMAQVMKIHQYAIMSSPTQAQWAAVEALESAETLIEPMKQAYNQRRHLVMQGLKAAGLSFVQPQGAFYAFPSIEGLGLDDETFCERLLLEQRVAFVPGSAFGTAGRGHVRLSYAASEEVIEEAMTRLKTFVSRLKQA